MNNRAVIKNYFRRAWIFSALFALALPSAGLRAQPVLQRVDNRLLIVFDTSTTMKKCLPITSQAVNGLFLSSLSSQLEPGDTMGVWTFNAQVSAGQFPLQTWRPEAAATIASNINVFVEQRHYADTTSFAPLLAMVNNVVKNSERLTVMIFCDGDGQFQGTPYDAAINSLFKQNQRAARQAKQPFVVVLRSQLGAYIGCQISSPPSPIGFPGFPPMPLPPAPPAPTNVPPPAPVVQTPPLIIVGTHVGTNLPPPESKPAPTNVPPPVQPIVPIVAPVVVVVTNIVAPTNSLAVPTNTPATSSENSDPGGKKPLAIGAVLLIAAGILIALAAFRMRRPAHGSLITRSMNRKK